MRSKAWQGRNKAEIERLKEKNLVNLLIIVNITTALITSLIGKEIVSFNLLSAGFFLKKVLSVQVVKDLI